METFRQNPSGIIAPRFILGLSQKPNQFQCTPTGFCPEQKLLKRPHQLAARVIRQSQSFFVTCSKESFFEESNRFFGGCTSEKFQRLRLLQCIRQSTERC